MALPFPAQEEADPGRDTLFGGASIDTFYLLGGGDTVDGGSGRTDVDYRFSPAAATVDVEAGTGSTAGGTPIDVFSGSSRVSVGGSLFADTLLGHSGRDELFGRGGRHD
jgi:Ca2+-binding RTX toxin-like protein